MSKKPGRPLIAKSDLIIVALSATFLVAGIIRWQHNTSVVPVVTIPASSQSTSVSVATDQNQEFAPIVTRLPARAETPSTSNRQLRTVESLAASTNRETVPAPVEPDEQIRTAVLSESVSPVSDPSAQLLGTYTVVSGDYLGWIAEEFGTTVATLKELNGLDGNDIRIGQEIKYPLPN